MLSGASGQFYGNRYTWPFLDGWQEQLDTDGSRQMGYMARFFSNRPWFRLVPDRTHRFVIAGYGRFSDAGSVNDSDYAPAARTPDGKFAVVYLPSVRTVTVDMAKLAGSVRAQWFDPAAGTYEAAASRRLRNAGTMKFAPPGENAGRDSDWVLVLTTS